MAAGSRPASASALARARSLGKKQRSPWQKKIVRNNKPKIFGSSTSRRPRATGIKTSRPAGIRRPSASGIRRPGGPKPGTSGALRKSKRFQTLKSKGTVSSVGQYRKRLGSARYLTKAQFKAKRPGGSFKKYQSFVAKRTGQSMGQVRSKSTGKPSVKKFKPPVRPAGPRRTTARPRPMVARRNKMTTAIRRPRTKAPTYARARR